MEEADLRNIHHAGWLGFVIVLLGIGAAQTVSTNGLDKAKSIDLLMEQHKMTLPKAVSAAERKSKGRAIRAIPDVDDQGQLHVHVHCLAADKILHVDVDGDTGKSTMAEVPDLEQRAASVSTTASGPSSPPAPPVVPTITLAQLEFKSKDYLNKRVRITSCRYGGGNSEGDLYRLYLTQDSHNNLDIYAEKERMADVLVQLKSNALVNVEGIVRWEGDRKRYILACDKLEIVPSTP
jgi:hypothetical protein